MTIAQRFLTPWYYHPGVKSTPATPPPPLDASRPRLLACSSFETRQQRLLDLQLLGRDLLEDRKKFLEHLTPGNLARSVSICVLASSSKLLDGAGKKWTHVQCLTRIDSLSLSFYLCFLNGDDTVYAWWHIIIVLSHCGDPKQSCPLHVRQRSAPTRCCTRQTGRRRKNYSRRSGWRSDWMGNGTSDILFSCCNGQHLLLAYYMRKPAVMERVSWNRLLKSEACFIACHEVKLLHLSKKRTYLFYSISIFLIFNLKRMFDSP